MSRSFFRFTLVSLFVCASAFSAKGDRRSFLHSCAAFVLAPSVTPETLALEEFAQSVILKLKSDFPRQSFETALRTFRTEAWAQIQAQAAREKFPEDGFEVTVKGSLALPRRRFLILEPRFEIFTSGFLGGEHRVIAIARSGSGPFYRYSLQKPQP